MFISVNIHLLISNMSFFRSSRKGKYNKNKMYAYKLCIGCEMYTHLVFLLVQSIGSIIYPVSDFRGSRIYVDSGLMSNISRVSVLINLLERKLRLLYLHQQTVCLSAPRNVRNWLP